MTYGCLWFSPFLQFYFTWRDFGTVAGYTRPLVTDDVLSSSGFEEKHFFSRKGGSEVKVKGVAKQEHNKYPVPGPHSTTP